MKLIYAIFSIIFYSVLIDVLCFFIFPVKGSYNIFNYIANGIIFNSPHVLINAVLVVFSQKFGEFVLKNKKQGVINGY